MKIKLTTLNIVDYDEDNRRKVRFVEEMKKDVLINSYFSDLMENFLDRKNNSIDMKIGYGYLVADEKNLVGFIQPVRLQYRETLDLNYAVHPDYRRQGYGSKILSEVSDYYFTNQSSIKNIRLYISKENIRSIGCAEKAGFYKDHEMDRYNLSVYMKNR